MRDAEQVKLKRLVRLGTVRKEIIAVAREEHIDLVVLDGFEGVTREQALAVLDLASEDLLMDLENL